MKIEQRYERILKDLDRCTQLARRGASLHDTLETKLGAQRVVRMLEESLRVLLLNYYEFEDAVRPIQRKEPIANV